MNEAPAAFGICTKTQRCGWRGTSLFSIPFVVWRSRADNLRLSVAVAATSQRSSLIMVGSLLRAALVDSGYQVASMDAGGPNGQRYEHVQLLELGRLAVG